MNAPALARGEITASEYLEQIGWGAAAGAAFGTVFGALGGALSPPRPATTELVPTRPPAGRGASPDFVIEPPHVNRVTGEITQTATHLQSGEAVQLRLNPGTGEASMVRLSTGEVMRIRLPTGRMLPPPSEAPSSVGSIVRVGSAEVVPARGQVPGTPRRLPGSTSVPALGTSAQPLVPGRQPVGLLPPGPATPTPPSMPHVPPIGASETTAGEVLGQVPSSRMPTATWGTTPYGQAMEPMMEEIVRARFPRTRFRFGTGAGATGPDVRWRGGEDPGFDIADFKPDTESGYSKFITQTRRWAGEGWAGTPAPSGPIRAAYIAYTPHGEIYVGDVAIVGR